MRKCRPWASRCLGVRWNSAMEFAYRNPYDYAWVKWRNVTFVWKKLQSHTVNNGFHLSFSTSISSTMSNQPKDSSLRPLSYLKTVFARLHLPKSRSMNDSTGAARSSSSPPVMGPPSSAMRTAEAGMAVKGEILDNPSDHQVNINPHLIEHCR